MILIRLRPLGLVELDPIGWALDFRALGLGFRAFYSGPYPYYHLDPGR